MKRLILLSLMLPSLALANDAVQYAQCSALFTQSKLMAQSVGAHNNPSFAQYKETLYKKLDDAIAWYDRKGEALSADYQDLKLMSMKPASALVRSGPSESTKPLKLCRSLLTDALKPGSSSGDQRAALDKS